MCTNLIISVAPDPVVLFESAHEVLAGFIVGKDDGAEGHGGDPVKSMDGAGSERKVEDGDVAQKGTESGFPGKTEVQPSVSHALSHEGEFAGLAANQVGPLDNDDRDEEGALGMGEGFLGVVANTFHFNVARLEGVHGSIVLEVGVRAADGTKVFGKESGSQPREDGGIKSIVVQNNEVGVESGNGLDDTDLEVGEDNQFGGD